MSDLIYVKTEILGSVIFTIVNRAKLNSYLPETQKRLGGRFDKDSTFNGLSCYHLNYEEYKKVAYIYVYLNRDVYKILREFVIDYLPETYKMEEDLQLFNFDLIRHLLIYFPPIEHSYDGFSHIDEKLNEIIKKTYFPFSVDTYYELIFKHIWIDTKPIVSLDLLFNFPFIRQLDIPLICNMPGEYGDLNIVEANSGTFGYVNYLFINSQEVTFEYANVAVVNCSYAKPVNCRILIKKGKCDIRLAEFVVGSAINLTNCHDCGKINCNHYKARITVTRANPARVVTLEQSIEGIDNIKKLVREIDLMD